MAKSKYDGVVEAVRYGKDGRIAWARTYLRRGPAWSDYILLDRQTLIEHIKAGRRIMAGRRIPQLAGTFEVSTPLRVIQSNEEDVLVAGDIQADRDRLDGVPVL